MNFNRLQLDHPCVINYIRSHYLNKPSPPNTPLKLDYPEVADPSEGQPKTILSLLKIRLVFFDSKVEGLYYIPP